MADPADYVEAHRDTFGSILELCRGLDEADWPRPTGCPGWSVQDQVAHVCDVESWLLGDERPELADVSLGGHVVNPLGERMELGVEWRRTWSPTDMITDLDRISKRRLEQIAEVTAPQLEETAYGHPLGPMPLRNFLLLRVMDIFIHEGDIRRAVDRPGTIDRPAARMTVTAALKAIASTLYNNAPELRGRLLYVDVDGLTATLDMSGERGRAIIPAVDPPWAIALDLGNFLAWFGRRSDRADFAWYGKEPAGDDLRLAHEAFRAHAGLTP